ncbi:hypothetical protein EMPS_04472 [Entomortierella parvispora]|uniref:glucan endo-1,3-beta-D-glucosidase n=1 Tax=Entomortierella parvispora TaxID=205924 RepID=A0A9P3LVU9_9FUNG|nr:hypothetical protein EMPS_04472 [Entomortierella parvispora]
MDPYQQHHPPSNPVVQVDVIEEATVQPHHIDHQHYMQPHHEHQQQQQQQQQEIIHSQDDNPHNAHNLYIYQPPQFHSGMQPMAPPQAHIAPSSTFRSSDPVIGAGQPPLEASCSSSMTATPTEALSYSSRASSVFGSLFQQKQHARKSSSVLGWDSDDDEELDQVTMSANGANNNNNNEISAAHRPESTSGSEEPLAPMSEKSPWLRKQHGKQKQVKTCLCLGVILCFLVLGVILVFTLKEQMAKRVVGSQPHQGGGDDKGPGGGEDTRKRLHESIESMYHVNKTINRDARLPNVLYGLDYTPRGSQEPGCKINLGTVIEDIKVISQLTNRIRLYGMACRQAEYVLKAIEYLELKEMQVILTLWVDHNPQASWERQSKMFWHLIDNELQMDAGGNTNDGPQTSTTTGTVHISKIASRIIGVSVGNEVLFRNEDKSKPKERVPLDTLIDYMNQIRSGLAQRAAAAAASSDPQLVAQGEKLAQIPVFSSDLGRNAHQIVDQEDWVMSNIHPFFANTAVENAATWAFANFKDETLKAAAGKPAMISEVGWPSGPASAKMGSAVPSVENLQTFLDTWVCQANSRNVPYYYFEAFDEPWKNSINSREAQWGLMTVDRRLKVNIPVC